MIRASLDDIITATEQAFGPMNFERACTPLARHQRKTAIHAMRKFGYPKPSSVSMARAFRLKSHVTVLRYLAMPVDEGDMRKVAAYIPKAQIPDVPDTMTVGELLIDIIRTSSHQALNKRVKR